MAALAPLAYEAGAALGTHLLDKGAEYAIKKGKHKINKYFAAHEQGPEVAGSILASCGCAGTGVEDALDAAGGIVEEVDAREQVNSAILGAVMIPSLDAVSQLHLPGSASNAYIRQLPDVTISLGSPPASATRVVVHYNPTASLLLGKVGCVVSWINGAISASTPALQCVGKELITLSDDLTKYETLSFLSTSLELTESTNSELVNGVYGAGVVSTWERDTTLITPAALKKLAREHEDVQVFDESDRGVFVRMASSATLESPLGPRAIVNDTKRPPATVPVSKFFNMMSPSNFGLPDLVGGRMYPCPAQHMLTGSNDTITDILSTTDGVFTGTPGVTIPQTCYTVTFSGNIEVFNDNVDGTPIQFPVGGVNVMAYGMSVNGAGGYEVCCSSSKWAYLNIAASDSRTVNLDGLTLVSGFSMDGTRIGGQQPIMDIKIQVSHTTIPGWQPGSQPLPAATGTQVLTMRYYPTDVTARFGGQLQDDPMQRTMILFKEGLSESDSLSLRFNMNVSGVYDADTAFATPKVHPGKHDDTSFLDCVSAANKTMPMIFKSEETCKLAAVTMVEAGLSDAVYDASADVYAAAELGVHMKTMSKLAGMGIKALSRNKSVRRAVSRAAADAVGKGTARKLAGAAREIGRELYAGSDADMYAGSDAMMRGM
jgi:hypothetical protein